MELGSFACEGCTHPVPPGQGGGLFQPGKPDLLPVSAVGLVTGPGLGSSVSLILPNFLRPHFLMS